MHLNLEKDEIKLLAEEVAKLILSDERFEARESNPEITYLTRDEAAFALRISLPTIDSYCRKGILVSSKIGKRILIRKDEVDRLVDQSVRYPFKRGGEK